MPMCGHVAQPCRYLALLLLCSLRLSSGGEQGAFGGYRCGEANGPLGRTHVRGGQQVQSNRWPWVVSIRLSSNNAHVCAGALVSPGFVLTAAHCLGRRSGARRSPRDLFVSLGVHRLGARGRGESWVTAKAFHVHPSYRSPSVRAWAYDMALIELQYKRHDMDTQRPACLPSDRVAPEHREMCVVVGWGKTEDARYSTVMMEAVIPVINRTECNQDKYWDEYIDRTMFCAGDVLRMRSACQGDSGGPLICLRGDQWTVYGIVSWGPVLCGGKPSVYSNVAAVGIPWIRRVLSQAGNDFAQLTPEPRDYVRTTPLVWLNATTTTRPPSPNGTQPTPPCDAELFERIRGFDVRRGDADEQTFEDVNAKECLEQCCQRGDQCRAFVYYPRTKQCGLRKLRPCDFADGTEGGYSSDDAIYYGLHCTDK